MLCSPDILNFARMAPEHSLEVPEGPGSAPEVSGMSRNCPGRSRKLLEGHGRFRKVPGSTTHCPAPLALGGNPPRLPWPARWWGRIKGGGILLQVGLPNPYMEGFRWEGVGRFGRLGSPSWTPNPPWPAPRPLGHLYKVSQGGRDTQVPGAP